MGMLENMRNMSKCYGYIQPDTLYEQSENFTDDNTENIIVKDYDDAESDTDDLLDVGNVISDKDECKILSDDEQLPNLPFFFILTLYSFRYFFCLYDIYILSLCLIF